MTLNERRATPHGPFWGANRGDGAWFRGAGKPKPALQELGFTESNSTDYAVRTRQNVEQSDATLIFATNPDSDGTRLTVDHAKKIGKPYLVLNPFEPGAADAVTPWLQAIQSAVLNVAGNRESKAPGIARQAEKVLHAVLSLQAID